MRISDWSSDVCSSDLRGSTVVISAGNSGADAANYSPGNCPGVITVAANGIYSTRAFYSNYGSTVEIAAPGGGVYPNDGSSATPINDGFIWQAIRSAEHTSELQSLMRISYAVFCFKNKLNHIE